MNFVWMLLGPEASRRAGSWSVVSRRAEFKAPICKVVATGIFHQDAGHGYTQGCELHAIAPTLPPYD